MRASIYAVRRPQHRRRVVAERPKRVSDDPGDFIFEPQVSYSKNDHPIEYNCQRVSGKRTYRTIQFEIELGVERGKDEIYNVESFQWILLDQIVATIGLDDCSFDKQRKEADDSSRSLRSTIRGVAQPAATGQYKRKLSAAGLPESTSIVMLASSKVESLGKMDDCSNLEYTELSTVCYPYNIRMDVAFVDTLEDETVSDDDVDRYLTSIIERQVNTQFGQLIVANLVSGYCYTDRRWQSSIIGPDEANEGVSSISNVVIGVISFALVFAILGAFCFCARRKRKRTRSRDASSPPSEKEVVISGSRSLASRSARGSVGSQRSSSSRMMIPSPMADPIDEHQDIENENSVHPMATVPTISGSSSTSSSSSSSDEDDQVGSAQPAIVEENPGESLQVGHAFSQRPFLEPPNESEALIVLSSSSSSSSASAASSVEDAAPSDLPPRPPAAMPRRDSRKLKKNRKKRKKRKRRVLIRTNSKDGIREMQTIPESEDEDSDVDFGSDCDDASSTTSSVSCPGSPVHVFEDDASETGGLGVGQPSPIKEETIRPIPPPWI